MKRRFHVKPCTGPVACRCYLYKHGMCVFCTNTLPKKEKKSS